MAGSDDRAADAQQPLLHDHADADHHHQPVEHVSLSKLLSVAFAALVWNNGVVALVLATLCFSVMSLSVKLVAGSIPVFQLVFLRSSVSFVMTTYLAHARNVSPIMGHTERYHWLLLRGALGTAGMTLYYTAIQMLPLATAVTVFFTNPAFTVVLEFLLLGEPIGWGGAFSCVACCAGVALVSHPSFLFGGAALTASELIGLGFGGAAAICIAGSFVTVRYLSRTEHSLVLTLWYHLVAALSSLPPLLLGIPAPGVLLPGWRNATLIASVVLMSFFGQLLLNRGFALLSASRGSGINVLQVVFSYVLDILVLHSAVHWYGIAGAGLIASGVLALSAQRTMKGAVGHYYESVDRRHEEQIDPELFFNDISARWSRNGRDGAPGGSYWKLVEAAEQQLHQQEAEAAAAAAAAAGGTVAAGGEGREPV